MNRLSAFKDSSNSLGLNMYLMQEPAEPEKMKDEYDMIEMTEVKCKPPGIYIYIYMISKEMDQTD